jgi:hypothetical protein
MGAWGTQAILMLGTVKQPVGIKNGRKGPQGFGNGLPLLGSDGKMVGANSFPWKGDALQADGSQFRIRP